MPSSAEQARVLRLDEPSGRWSLLELPADPGRALLLAAAGVVAASPPSDGRARALELMEAGGPGAVLVAVTILREALGGALQR